MYIFRDLKAAARIQETLLPRHAPRVPGADFAWISFVDNEGSESANGLPYRWIVKGFLFLGLVLLLAGVLSVLLRTIVFLFGSERLRGEAGYGTAKIPS